MCFDQSEKIDENFFFFFILDRRFGSYQQSLHGVFQSSSQCPMLGHAWADQSLWTEYRAQLEE